MENRFLFSLFLGISLMGLTSISAQADEGDPFWFKYVPRGVRQTIRDHHGRQVVIEHAPSDPVLEVDVDGDQTREISAIDNQQVNVDFSGDAQVKLSGKTEKLNITGSGSATVDARDLTATEVDIDVTGSATLYVRSNQRLGVHADGSARIHVYGSPTITENDLRGGARLIQN